jgi:hypothetical protein
MKGRETPALPLLMLLHRKKEVPQSVSEIQPFQPSLLSRNVVCNDEIGDLVSLDFFFQGREKGKEPGKRQFNEKKV